MQLRSETPQEVEMKKITFLFIYACLIGFSTQSFANFSMNGMQSLQDHQLAEVVGQAKSINTVDDLYDQNQIQKISDFVSQLTTPELQNDGIGLLTSLFYINDHGQTVLQINRPVLAIGVIEATLSVNGFSEIGQSLAKELSFK